MSESELQIFMINTFREEVKRLEASNRRLRELIESLLAANRSN